jgi:hypothetical protein
MNIEIRRNQIREDGIFSEIYDSDNGGILFLGLERGYKNKAGKISAKIKKGKYLCKRGIHKLADLKEFETFEITGVKGHWGILFHAANYDHELEGCVALGMGYGKRADGGQMITSSKQAFNRFMELQKGVDEFYLTVV